MAHSETREIEKDQIPDNPGNHDEKFNILEREMGKQKILSIGMECFRKICVQQDGSKGYKTRGMWSS